MNEFTLSNTYTEPNRSRRSSEQRIVISTSYVVARVEFGSSLSNDDGTCFYKFTAKSLDSQHLGVGVATVSGGPHSFLMSHCETPGLGYSAAASAAAFGFAAFLDAFSLAPVAETASILILVYG